MSEFFKHLKHHESFFKKHGELVTFKKGQYLVMASEPSKWVYFLIDGCVLVSFTFDDGVDRLIGYFLPGMTFAQSGSFFNDDGGGLEYCACQTSKVLRVDRKDFLRQLSSDRDFNNDYVDSILRNQIFLIERIVYQGEKGIHNKCIRWLLFMAKYYGVTSGKSVTLIVPVTQETAANFMHATRESASAALGKLKKAGLVTSNKKFITITDIDKLQGELN